MNLRKLFIEFSTRHDAYYRLFVIVCSILIITGYLPHQLRFKYDFSVGSTWNYDDLKAPFDFPIYKSDKEIESEKRLAVESQPPFYRVDSSAAGKSLATFRNSYSGDASSVDAGIAIIKKIYNKGLIRPSNELTSPAQKIWVVNGNKVREKHIDELLSTNQAAAFIEQELISKNIQHDSKLFESLQRSIEPDIIYDTELTTSASREKLTAISITRGMIPKGSIIAEKGMILSQYDVTVLESLRRTFEEQPRSSSPFLTYLGYLLLVSIAIVVLLIFLYLFRKDILLDNRKLTLLFLLIVAITLLFTFILGNNQISTLVVPLCILPLVTRAFFDTRTALFTHVLTTLILATVAPNGFEFVFMQIIAGMVAIFSIVNMRRRAQLFVAVGLIFISYLIGFAGLSLINEGNMSEIKLSSLGWLGGNVLLTLISYPLIFFIEKVFGVTSDFTLIELTDFNNVLLREMSVKAPGTFQHSLQVANLAEAAIYKIGGNSLLVRVGALYHDIGKIEMPLYFIENQSTQMNPHDELSFDESAGIIISHVIRGIEKAKKSNLPDAVIDFIRTHHGTMMVQYFYQSYLKNYPDKVPNDDDFRYPGPKPFSRETAVLMMADSVEASARSLSHHDSESIDKLVDNIINHQISSDQFENCDITYRDITTIKRIFKRMLSSIYHVRIAYPSAG